MDNAKPIVINGTNASRATNMCKRDVERVKLWQSMDSVVQSFERKLNRYAYLYIGQLVFQLGIESND